MGAYVMKVISLIGIVFFATGLAVEIRNWRSGRRMISRKQQIIRLAAGMLFILLFAMLFVGSSIKWTGYPIEFMLYWMACFVIACTIVVLMMLDLRELGNRYREQQIEMLRRMREEAKRK